MDWTDITSYSQSEERIPSWWRIKLDRFILKVGNKHIYHREDPKWFMTFDQGREVLGDKDELTEEQAKIKALEIVSDRLDRASSAVFDALMAMQKGN